MFHPVKLVGNNTSANLVIGPSLSVIRIIFAPWLYTPLHLIPLVESASDGAIAMTGVDFPMSAIAPCLSSPQDKPNTANMIPPSF